MAELSDVNIEAISPVYETEPCGFSAQSDFLNLAVRIDTELTPEQLLEKTQSIEQELGRIRMRRYGPRTIDIDILIFENQERNDERLSLPHPRMHERAFVLVPLRDVMPGMREKIPEGQRVSYYDRIEPAEPCSSAKNSAGRKEPETRSVEDNEKTDIIGECKTD